MSQKVFTVTYGAAHAGPIAIGNKGRLIDNRWLVSAERCQWACEDRTRMKWRLAQKRSRVWKASTMFNPSKCFHLARWQNYFQWFGMVFWFVWISIRFCINIFNTSDIENPVQWILRQWLYWIRNLMMDAKIAPNCYTASINQHRYSFTSESMSIKLLPQQVFCR